MVISMLILKLSLLLISQLKYKKCLVFLLSHLCLMKHAKLLEIKGTFLFKPFSEELQGHSCLLMEVSSRFALKVLKSRVAFSVILSMESSVTPPEDSFVHNPG